MEWSPNKWIAVLLGFFFPPLGMLYIARAKLAWLYLIASLTAGTADTWLDYQLLDLPNSNFLTFFIMIFSASHIFKILSNDAPLSHRPWFSRWYGLISTTLLLFMTIYSFRAFMYEPFHIPAGSMSPTLNPGDMIIVSKWGYGNYGSYGITATKKPISKPLNIGDVVVFEFPMKPEIRYIKRIIGLPRDTIEFKKGSLIINGSEAQRKVITSISGVVTYQESIDTASYYISTVPNRPAVDGKVTVPDGHLFVLGDNRDNSNDSRYWGFVPIENIVGKLVYIF